MNKENTDYLFNKYPKLYAQKDLTEEETCLVWGFECGNGWFDLINNLSNLLEAINIFYKDKIKIQATQVKSKFGTLRFYYDILYIDENKKYKFIRDCVDNILNEAEAESETICEKCGSENGIMRNDGWVTCLCDNCCKK